MDELILGGIRWVMSIDAFAISIVVTYLNHPLKIRKSWIRDCLRD